MEKNELPSVLLLTVLCCCDSVMLFRCDVFSWCGAGLLLIVVAPRESGFVKPASQASSVGHCATQRPAGLLLYISRLLSHRFDL